MISFTVETDGNLPTGDSLGKAINIVDRATGNGPAYYMVNCAHPTHYESKLMSGEPWVERIGGMRANASRMSHAELDNATELDDGNPVEFGRQFADIRSRLKRHERARRLLRHRPSPHRADRDELRRGEGCIIKVNRAMRRPGMFPAALLCGMVRQSGKERRSMRRVLPSRQDR